MTMFSKYFYTVIFSCSVASTYALTDLTVINQLSSTDSVLVDGHALNAGESKTTGINIFSRKLPISICSSDNVCQQLEVKDDQRVCGYRTPVFSPHDKIPTHYSFDLLVHGGSQGTLCAFGSDQMIFFAAVPVTLTLTSSSEGSYRAVLSGGKQQPYSGSSFSVYNPELYTINPSSHSSIAYTW